MSTSFKFAEFELHPERFELCRGKHALRMERKPMELLILLTAGGGRVISRTEIAEHLWGREVFVDSEHGINTAVRKLRQVLRDDPEKPRFIQTIPKMGYRFLAPVSAYTDQAPLPVAGPVPPATGSPAPSLVVSSMPDTGRSRLLAVGGAAVCLLLIAVASIAYRSRSPVPEVRYEQLTDLTDAALAPAISPDGHTVAFIRANSSDSDTSGGFASTGPIYVKALPNGEEKLVSTDNRLKYGLAFSPDGSEIAYTAFGQKTLATYTVSVFGGEAHLLRNNAAGLTWLSAHQLLFSEIRSGIHLGVVTGTSTEGAVRDVYFPAHQRGMAHYSLASPDHNWILVVEMDGSGNWAPCRLVPLAGHSETRLVGPNGACKAAAWSTDGRWMYFTAIVAGKSHLWRQRFPEGAPQQITFGAAEEEGLAVERTGNSLITSVGTTQNALWIHDERGERALSAEGEVISVLSPPLFRQDDTVLFYLLRHRSGQTGTELWRAEPKTGRSDVVVSDFSILDYDVSSDGKQVVFSAETPSGTELWLAPTDRSHPPTKLGVRGGNFPHFDAAGKILFQSAEGNANYLEEVAMDGLRRSKLVSFPINVLEGVSPAGRWAMTLVAESASSTHPTLVAIPVAGAASRRICPSICFARWSSNGRSLFIPVELPSKGNSGRSIVIPVGPNERIPDVPPGAPSLLTAQMGVPGGPEFIPAVDRFPGKDPAHYAFLKTSVQRNLFRVTMR